MREKRAVTRRIEMRINYNCTDVNTILYTTYCDAAQCKDRSYFIIINICRAHNASLIVLLINVPGLRESEGLFRNR